MLDFQGTINTKLDAFAQATAAGARVSSASLGLLPDRLEGGAREVELETRTRCSPGIKAAIEASDPDDFRDYLTDAVVNLK